MPTALDFQESECPQLRSFRNLNATALIFQGIQIPENPELWAFRFLKI